MRIAITGHTAGIGKALAEKYQQRGHEIVGLSKRDGHNIRNIPKIADHIEPCDMFINNAQAGFAQTELLLEMSRRWNGTNKHIMIIGTMLTQIPVNIVSNLRDYWCQKTALENIVKQLRYDKIGIKFTIIRPGDIATSTDKTVPPSADVNVWTSTLIELLELADKNNLIIPELSLGPAN